MPDSVASSIPVIVGVAQIVDRHPDTEIGQEPLALIKAALLAADRDAGGGFLSRVDSLDIQAIFSWAYEDIGKRLSDQLSLRPSRCVLNDVSGDQPIRNLCDAAHRIATGSSSIAIVCGGEATSSVRHAYKNKLPLTSWTPPAAIQPGVSVDLPAIAGQYGLDVPTSIYPLFENACRSRWGQTLAEGQLESGNIWSRSSQIAARCEHAWIRKAVSVVEVITPSADNKLIAWPYTKLMVANNFVNGASAVILTSLQLAIDAGIPEDRLVYLCAGGYANELDDFLLRERFDHSPALEVAINSTLQRGGISSQDLDYAELYSCFPVVPKLARRVLHWSDARDLTVLGGMTFGGAQLTNYMTQATAEMVNKLRGGGNYGMLYGNGHFLTHAAGLLLSRSKPQKPAFLQECSLQKQRDALGEASPMILDRYAGSGKIETYTVLFDKEGKPETGIIVARTPDNRRFIAKTAEHAPLMDPVLDPIGRSGTSVMLDGYNQWRWSL